MWYEKIAFGNTWVVAALVVRLRFCPSPVALPARAVLYGPKPPPTGKRGRPRAKAADIIPGQDDSPQIAFSVMTSEAAAA